MRKEINFTVTDEGRDHGKTFHIKEMSAMQGAKFALKAFSKAARCGMDVPKDAQDAGMLALAKAGYTLLVAMPFEMSEELHTELMGCIKFVASPQVTRNLVENDIEEIQTVFKLTKAVYDLHVDFFPVGSQSISESVQSVNKKPTLSIKVRQ